jgi:predicted PurR-regulated permease PerM
MSQPERTPVHRIVAATVAAVSVGVAMWLVLRFGVVLIGFFVAVLLSAAVRPIVGLLERRLGRLAADALVHMALVAGVAVFIVAALPVLVEQVSSLVNELPSYYESFRQLLLDTASEPLRRIGRALPRTFAGPVEPASLDSVGEALAWLRTATSALLTGTAVVLLSFYWTLEREIVTRSLLVLVPLERRKAASDLVQAAGRKLSGYVRGQLIVCAAVGAMAFVAYWLIGLPNVFALALMAGVLEAVPVIGPTLGALPAGLVAMTIDPTLGVWVAVSTLIIQAVENALLVPRVMDREVGVNPLITLLAITGFGSALGVVGAVLAIPLAALVQLVVGRFLIREDGAAPPTPEGRDQVSALRYEAQQLVIDVRRMVRNKPGDGGRNDSLEDAVESIASDLDRMLAGPGAAGAPSPGAPELP